MLNTYVAKQKKVSAIRWDGTAGQLYDITGMDAEDFEDGPPKDGEGVEIETDYGTVYLEPGNWVVFHTNDWYEAFSDGLFQDRYKSVAS